MSRYYLGALVLGAGCVAVASRHLVYPYLSWNRDEPVYLWQADLLRSGQLTSTDGGFPALFQPWLSAHHDGRFFSQYPLGWPSAIAVGGAVGWQDLTLVIASVLAVLGAYALTTEVTRRREVAAVTATLFLCSPIFAVQGGVFLTYLFATGLGCCFAAGLLRGVRLPSKSALFASGACLGLLVATRTFDAVVWAVAVGGYIALVERHRWRELMRLLPPFLAGVVPLVALQLLHNWSTTGSPTQFAITVADPLDRFGFGDRRLMPRLDPVDYTPGVAAKGTLKHLFFLPWFLVGAHVGGLVAILGAWWERRRAGTGLLVVLCLAFPIAYFPFWGIHISSLTTRISGPIYYIPAYVPICALLSLGLVAIARRRPAALLVTIAAIVTVTVPVAVGRLGLNRQLSRVQNAWARTAEEIPDGSIVAVSPSPYLLYLAPEGISRPDRPGRLTYVTDESPTLVEFLERSRRRAFVLRPTVPAGELAPSEHTRPFGVEAVPLEVVSGPTLDLDVKAVSPATGVMVVDVTVDETRRWSAPVRRVRAGESTTVQVLMGSNSRLSGRAGVAIGDAPATVDVTVGFGRTATAARSAPRVRYRVLLDGGDMLRALSQGRTYRPVEAALTKGELRWTDGVPSEDVEFDISQKVSAGG
ncbi:MAG: hypothetical protein KDB02_02410 [Acidimicrobiales bacterium]|nr:hypothetical protein [Acidimicrobiales bacterium]